MLLPQLFLLLWLPKNDTIFVITITSSCFAKGLLRQVAAVTAHTVATAGLPKLPPWSLLLQQQYSHICCCCSSLLLSPWLIAGHWFLSVLLSPWLIVWYWFLSLSA